MPKPPRPKTVRTRKKELSEESKFKIDIHLKQKMLSNDSITKILKVPRNRIAFRRKELGLEKYSRLQSIYNLWKEKVPFNEITHILEAPKKDVAKYIKIFDLLDSAKFTDRDIGYHTNSSSESIRQTRNKFFPGRGTSNDVLARVIRSKYADGKSTRQIADELHEDLSTVRALFSTRYPDEYEKYKEKSVNSRMEAKMSKDDFLKINFGETTTGLSEETIKLRVKDYQKALGVVFKDQQIYHTKLPLIKEKIKFCERLGLEKK